MERFNSLLAIFSAALSFILTQMTPVDGEMNALFVHVGFFGIIAMILPGISGAYILLILGAYSTVISLIKNAITSLTSLQMEIMIFHRLSVFVLGIVWDSNFASILKWLFDKEHDKTMAVMIGLMAGALHKLWPWQQKFEWTLGENSKTLSKPISPFEYPENPQLALAVVFYHRALLGMDFGEKKKYNTPKVSQNNSSYRKDLILVLKGIAMGAANKVPGVSGGIVAFVAGFYEELIYSLQKINLKAFSILIRRGGVPSTNIPTVVLVLLFQALSSAILAYL